MYICLLYIYIKYRHILSSTACTWSLWSSGVAFMVECLLNVLSIQKPTQNIHFQPKKKPWTWHMTRNLRYSYLGFVSTMFQACCLFCGVYGQRAKVKELKPCEESRGWCSSCSCFWWKMNCLYPGVSCDTFLGLSFWGFQRVCHFGVPHQDKQVCRKAYFSI